ncbi:hypothetical protein ACHAXA_005555 [Cyclostephanos tholiformis]|uniref:WLM domain-containing protein n=1 Tax=Cyclostephanos tholiformis TaxID=382380 RepID=A0ABD3RGH2_9STRA
MTTTAPRNRKRPFGALVRTLNDITNSTAHYDVAGHDANVGGGGGLGGNDGKIAVRHIPSLPDEGIAASILRRIHAEFATLIEKRGWVVTSISEMCCCGDGLDCSTSRRKINIMPHNVLGYNRTTSASSRRGGVEKSHDIHLRLRHPRTHVMYDYESIAGTMCHELAHCVRGSHDARFYEAMNEIEVQRATFLAGGVVLGRDGFPLGDGGVALGGIGRARGARDGGGEGRGASPRAAESRIGRGRNGLTRGYVLGGDKKLGGRPPREAARLAAERRLLDSRYCLPCNEIIEILGEDDAHVYIDDDDDDDDERVEVVEGSKMTAENEYGRADSDAYKLGVNMADNDHDVIDLTFDNSSATRVSRGVALKSSSKREAQMKHMARPDNVAQSNGSGADSETWSCRRCTLFNRPTVLVCIACHTERPCQKTILEHAKELLKQDDVDYIKRREVQQSKETFGGFNIYGERKDSSSTMKHLT